MNVYTLITGRRRIAFDKNCPKATTTIQSGESRLISSTDAVSLMLTGCMIFSPILIAASFTGEGQGVLLLPFGLSGCVMTAIMLCADVTQGSQARNGKLRCSYKYDVHYSLAQYTCNQNKIKPFGDFYLFNT